jgi:aminoglycoside phosphotransferase (APT) family kinase protein
VLPPGVIHGDASIGNVLRDRQGDPAVIDLDGFAIGPPEWDVVLTAIYCDSFGWHTRCPSRPSTRRGSALYVSSGSCGLRPPVSSMVLEGMR